MKKLCFLLLSIPSISLAQMIGYGYAPRKESTTIIYVEKGNRQESSQVNYAKVGQDFNNTLNNFLEKREAQARALGWSSAAEMDAARKEEKRRIKREKALEREEKMRIKREEKEKAKALKREEDLEREKAKAIEKERKDEVVN